MNLIENAFVNQFSDILLKISVTEKQKRMRGKAMTSYSYFEDHKLMNLNIVMSLELPLVRWNMAQIWHPFIAKCLLVERFIASGAVARGCAKSDLVMVVIGSQVRYCFE